MSSNEVSANTVEVEDDGCPPKDTNQDYHAVFLDRVIKHDLSSPAAPSLPLRVTYPASAPGVKPECILDGGAQLVVTRKDIWEHLQLVPMVVKHAMPTWSPPTPSPLSLLASLRTILSNLFPRRFSSRFKSSTTLLWKSYLVDPLSTLPTALKSVPMEGSTRFESGTLRPVLAFSRQNHGFARGLANSKRILTPGRP